MRLTFTGPTADSVDDGVAIPGNGLAANAIALSGDGFAAGAILAIALAGDGKTQVLGQLVAAGDGSLSGVVTVEDADMQRWFTVLTAGSWAGPALPIEWSAGASDAVMTLSVEAA